MKLRSLSTTHATLRLAPQLASLPLNSSMSDAHSGSKPGNLSSRSIRMASCSECGGPWMCFRILDNASLFSAVNGLLAPRRACSPIAKASR